MKTAIATTLTALLVMGVGTAFAASPLANGSQNMPTPSGTPTQQSPGAQSGCSGQYPDFSQLDTKHQGYLTKKEVKKVPGLKEAFKKADTDHNGKLSQSEYAAWVQSKCGPSGQGQLQNQTPPPSLSQN